ncbi:MAG TPA: SMC-Scp complex subunit ScpB [Candidatus Paceibacterota bacterium]|nr:SMC-Scp complex subunit ScpB [Candidatus Paceibacterota bacterium]
MALSKAAELHALLFAAGEPMSKKKLGALLGVSAADVTTLGAEMAAKLQGSGIALIQSEEELELRTTPEASDVVQKLREGELTKDLGKAGLEALAVVLYQGGATRSEIDWIRGVNSAQTVRSLMLRGLVERIEDPSDKRKFRYRATTDALAHLGVAKREDLPRFAELSKEAENAVAASDTTNA